MLNQKLQQKQLQKLSPQQIQLMKLLQVPTVALEQRIKQEIEENPALEEGPEEDDNPDTADELNEDITSDFDEEEQDETKRNEEDEFAFDDYVEDDEIPLYKLVANNTSIDDEKKDIPFSVGASYQEQLLSQLGLRVLDDRKYQIASQIIGNLDDSGYLQRELSAMVDDLAFSSNIKTNINELKELLNIIQEFDPPGIGARNLQECLLIQLKRKEPQTVYIKTAILILEKYFDDFTKKHYDKISKKMEISDENLKNAVNEILKLNPKPGNSFNENSRIQQYIVPDYIITNNNGMLELFLNSKNAPDLRISQSYNEMLVSYSNNKNKMNEQKEAVLFVKQKIDSAKWFIDAIKQRQDTLYRTMYAILEYQKEYFLEGDETLIKPMILKDIAEKINLDISTISRVANSKYVQTPYGTFPLKSFFSESMSTDSGEEVSTREVKKILQDCIDSENKKKPLTDDELAKILKEKGYNIARRTIAKYREQLNIAVARMRKEI
ncbi:MAG TPA: RNA polymerase factor sigma-54 [Bacteroidales bacterium]|mgnify:CR=1 FL=1|nr:RNA polymerase factor sigma-54 [Bacteroidales bacterium]